MVGHIEWSNPASTPDVVNSLVLEPDDTILFCGEIAPKARTNTTPPTYRVCRLRGNLVETLLTDQNEVFSRLRSAPEGWLVLKTVGRRGTQGEKGLDAKQLLLFDRHTSRVSEIAMLRPDSIGFQRSGRLTTSWNTLFAFKSPSPGAEFTRWNGQPDETLQYRHNLMDVSGTAAFAVKESVMLLGPDGARRRVVLGGRVVGLEPEVGAPAFIAVWEQDDSYVITKIIENAQEDLYRSSRLSPRAWEVVSLLWSSKCKMLTLREKLPILKAYLFLSFDGKTVTSEEISGLKNFTVVPSADAMVGASRIDLLRSESQILVRRGG